MFGRRYAMPLKTRIALARVFEAPVVGVVVIENSLYARAHLGMCATTRPNRILLAISGAEFATTARARFKRYLNDLAQ
jgi:hypothetical protein